MKYRTARGKDAFAVVELENNHDEPYMNGYSAGTYNKLVTLYQPDAKKRITSLLNGEDNIVVRTQKNKGNLQRTSSIHVPSVLNKLPFATKVAQENDTVKMNSEREYKLPVEEDTSPP